MMRRRFLAGISAAAPVALVLMLPAAASAQQTENPPTFDASRIAGIQPVGSNYTIQNPVRSDGMLRVYNLTTPYGKFLVRGDAMMRMRINELKALAALQKVSNSDTFAKALVKAGLSPVKYTGKLITNPVGTVKGTLSGVGAFFDRLAAGAAAQGNTPDKPVASLLGVTDARRKLAARYGVDPYTDFPPLDAALKRLAQASTAGGLVVTGALMAVPGAAGVIVSNLSTANKLNDVAIDQLARDYTAAQILALNRKRLLAMKVPVPVIHKLLANRDFTPIDMAAMVAALDSMKRVRDREIFAERAAAAHPRYVAYFVRRQAELLANGYHHRAGYVRFVSLGGDPVVLDRRGRLDMVAPIDALSWTKDSSISLTRMTAAAKRVAPKRHGEVHITGMATKLATRMLKKQGWTVREHPPN
jgi:hypothetical protein